MQLVEQYKKTRKSSMDMVKPLKTEDFVIQAEVFASPVKWNLGHTTWFFEEFVLKNFDKNYKSLHPRYNFIFNSYYNAVGDRVVRNRRGNLSRPAVDEVFQYRKHVDKHMELLIGEEDVSNKVRDMIILGLNHEQQHQELFFTDLKYNFSVNPLFPEYSNRACCEDRNQGENGFLQVDEGIYEIGFDGDGFCYDNELDKHQVFVPSFEISHHLVTNGEYLEFIEDKGYQRFEFWHDEALAWITENNINKPLYWHKIDGKWYQYTLAGLKLLNNDDILTHISYYEAFAFAQWKGQRLPTEFEWEVASEKLNWGQRWEWTESAYMPYPGFKRAEGAVGEYNGKFMVNQKVLRGASVVTPEGHSRKTYRNFFHPHVAYQFNGIRLAK